MGHHGTNYRFRNSPNRCNRDKISSIEPVETRKSKANDGGKNQSLCNKPTDFCFNFFDIFKFFPNYELEWLRLPARTGGFTRETSF